MPRVPLPLPLGSYLSEVLPLSAERVINWIPVVSESTALSTNILLQRNGLSNFSVTPTAICRGQHVMAGIQYSVHGNTLYTTSATKISTVIGTISGSKRVVMADNGTKLVIVVPGGNSYTYEGTTLAQITDVDFQVSDTVSFYRGFFVFTTTDGKQLFTSNLNQPSVFDALDFGSAEGDPDRIITQILNNDELTVLGEETSEVFKLVGGVGFPLQIIPGAFDQKGAHSKYGVIAFDNTFLFIGGGENEKTAVWRKTSSSNSTKISDNAIDTLIQEFNKDEIAESFLMTYTQRGQLLAILTINSIRIPSRTFVYNGTASVLAGKSVWFEYQTGVDDNSWRVNSIVKAYGEFLCGDAIDGRIGILDKTKYTDYDDVMFRQMSTAPFSQNGSTLFAGEFEATFESGVGLTSGQGSDPIVRMDYSDDGARTFGSEFGRSIGKIGKYEQQSIWKRQGSFPVSRTIRLTITDPVKANLIRLAATPELGID